MSINAVAAYLSNTKRRRLRLSNQLSSFEVAEGSTAEVEIIGVGMKDGVEYVEVLISNAEAEEKLATFDVPGWSGVGGAQQGSVVEFRYRFEVVGTPPAWASPLIYAQDAGGAFLSSEWGTANLLQGLETARLFEHTLPDATAARTSAALAVGVAATSEARVRLGFGREPVKVRR